MSRHNLGHVTPFEIYLRRVDKWLRRRHAPPVQTHELLAVRDANLRGDFPPDVADTLITARRHALQNAVTARARSPEPPPMP